MNIYRYVAVWREYPNGRLETGYITQPNLSALVTRMMEKFPDAEEVILVETKSNTMWSLLPTEGTLNACSA
jgi:hypothetical protein